MKYIRTKMVIFTHAGIIEASTPLAAVAKDGFWEVASGQFKGTPIQQYQCESLITHEEYWNVKESLEKANRAISQMEQIIQKSDLENQLLKQQLQQSDENSTLTLFVISRE